MWGLVSQLKAYVEEWFTGNRITIVGVGELFDALAAFSVKLVLRNLSTNLFTACSRNNRGPSRRPVFVYCKRSRTEWEGLEIT